MRITFEIKAFIPGYLKTTRAGNSFIWLAIGAALRESTRLLLADIQKNTPVYSGDSKASLRSYIRGQGVGMRDGVVTSVAPHYLNLVRGRRAGARRPPIGVIQSWLEGKGLDPDAAFVVTRNIGMLGIPSSLPSRSVPAIPTMAPEKAVNALAPVVERIFLTQLQNRMR